jgi:hypothetical protein
MSTANICIIGDYFMLPEVFEQKIRDACGDRVAIRSRKDNWPHEPMEHGYAVQGMDGLKEYFGTADDVVDFVADAEILVTQLAPMSRGMLERLPNLKMIAAFGGPNIRVADYARYGTDALSKNILMAMKGRDGCLMANHGMVVAGPDLTRTIWLANELEALAHQYYHALTIGGGHILSNAEIAETAKGFETYGIRTKGEKST